MIVCIHNISPNLTLTMRNQFFAYTLHDISLVDKENVYERERAREWALNIFFTEIIIIITTDDDDFVRLLAGWLLWTRRNLSTQIRYSLDSFCQLSFDVERRDVILEFILPSSRCCVIYVEKKKKTQKNQYKNRLNDFRYTFSLPSFFPKTWLGVHAILCFWIMYKIKFENGTKWRTPYRQQLSNFVCLCDKKCTEKISWISKFSIKKVCWWLFSSAKEMFENI